VRDHRALPHILVLLMSLLVLPVATSLDLGEYPPNNRSLFSLVKRWAFFAAKTAFLLDTILCAVLTLDSIGLAPIMGHLLVTGYILSFRWAIADQRRRCPVCLYTLTNPVRIGQSSQMFLDWYGTELICAKGHGVLQVPEIPTSCYRSQRWLSFDVS